MSLLSKRSISYLSVFGVIAGAPFAAAADTGAAAKLDPAHAPKVGQYVYDSFGRDARGGLVGNCVYTGYWTPQAATPECDPELFASPNLPGATRQAKAAAKRPSAAKATAAPTAASTPAGGAAPAPAAASSASPTSAPAAAATAGAAAAASQAHPSTQQAAAGAVAPSASSASEAAPAPLHDEITGRSVYEGEHGASEATAQAAGAAGSQAGQSAGMPAAQAAAAPGAGAPSVAAVAPVGSAAAGNTSSAQTAAASSGSASQPETGAGTAAGGASPTQQAAASPESGGSTAGAQAERPVAIFPVTVTVDAEPLFDFDRSAIRSDAKTRLDDLAKQIKGVQYGDIIAVGYADPIGTAVYNQELSERRAAAVKAYLVGLGIASDRIETEGRGRTEEFAGYAACGGLRSEKTITCLQPDRRVEVTVNARQSN